MDSFASDYNVNGIGISYLPAGRGGGGGGGGGGLDSSPANS